MAPLIEFQLFIVVAMMSHLDADVRIVQTRINAGNNCTECGEKLVLTCNIDNYFPKSTMTWQNENSSLTIVLCVGSNCNLNPAVGSEYSKSEDTTTGTFNLTIPTVTRDNNGISYLCENGLFTESSIVKVRDYRPILNETSGTTLKARTGCINESVKVMFSWRKLKAGSGAESYDDAEYIGTNATVDTDFCTQDTECGLNGFITLERTIEVEPGDENDYHLKAVISYDGFEMESVQTNKTYKIGAKCVSDLQDGFLIGFYCLLLIMYIILAIRNLCSIQQDLKESCMEVFIANVYGLVVFVCGTIIAFNPKCKSDEEFKPRTPKFFKYDKISVKHNSFKVRWTPASNGGSGLNFLLEWSTDNGSGDRAFIPYVNNNEMEYVIGNLKESTTYNVKICAEVHNEESESAYLTVKTSIKPRTPISFTYDESSVTHNSFKVRWTPASNGGSGLKFLLEWSTDNGSGDRAFIPYVNNYEMEHVIRKLKESTTYNVKICAVVNNVKSEFADSLTVVTVDGLLTKCKKYHQRIAGDEEICCESCKTTKGSLASHTYCLSHRLYLCLSCLHKKNTHETCAVLWHTGDINRKDHKLCCNKNYNHDDLQLKGACETCKRFICSQCIGKHEHTDYTSHQQLHGPRNIMARICCQQNETLGGTETVDLCIQCQKFICSTCLKLHNNHIVISSVIDKFVMDRKAALCCQPNAKARGNESVDFCIECKTFICASCLKEYNTCNHVDIFALLGLISTRAVMCCNLEKNNKIRNFCIQCQTFVCDPCKTKHETHFIVSSIMALSKKEFSCKGCQSVKRIPIECLALHKGVFLCASCYETGNLRKALKNKRESQEPIVMNFTNNQKSCQVHEVLGNVSNLQVEVYCLVCQLYMCLGCFKKHRRIYEHWSKYLEGNVFYCNRCQTGELNPVECCDFTSVNPEFECGNCYILNIPSDTKMAYTEKVMRKMKNLRAMNTKCQVHEDETKSSTAAVYCLVCKTTMCKFCFKEHLKFEK